MPGPARRPAHEPRLARVAALLADPARSRMLAYLLGGHHASAGELARAASVAPSTASTHLARLLEGGLVAMEPRGRHRYYRLADAEVAHALEALALVAERDSHARAWQHPARAPLREARCCYGHLAGALGVRLMDALQRDGRLHAEPAGPAEARALGLSSAGRAWLARLGLDAATVTQAQARRGTRWAYPCLDWSERRDHLAGGLASLLLQHFLAQGWLRSPAAGPARALELTPRGRQQLLPLLDA